MSAADILAYVAIGISVVALVLNIYVLILNRRLRQWWAEDDFTIDDPEAWETLKERIERQDGSK